MTSLLQTAREEPRRTLGTVKSSRFRGKTMKVIDGLRALKKEMEHERDGQQVDRRSTDVFVLARQ